MSSHTPFRPLPILALLLTLGACATVPEQAAEPSAEAAAEMQAAQERNAWLEQRNQTIQQLRQNPHLSITELQDGDIIVRVRSGSIFQTASTRINTRVEPVFAHIATTLAAQPGLSVRVIGHTDNIGNPQRNLDLSARRAESVRNALVEYGLEEARVSHEGLGDAEPIAPNDSREGRAVNRRVDLLISRHTSPSAEHQAEISAASGDDSEQAKP